MEYIAFNQTMIKKEELSIPFDDRGYYFGDGIYEVIRLYNGKPFALDDHLTRLIESAEKLDLPTQQRDSIKQTILTLIEKNKPIDGSIYIQITRGSEPRNHLYSRETKPTVLGFIQPLPSKTKSEARVWLEPDIRWLRCDIKSINLLGNVLAKRKAADHGCDEAILHRDTVLTEGSSSNVFLVKDQVLYTHPATNLILNGITRQIIIRLAKEHGLDVIEEPFPYEVLEHADEAFLTSTMVEVMPITEIEGEMNVTLPIGSITKKLQMLFKEQVH
ncbi:D-amino-acid transaminase [Halalkalibacter sp. AB-rgal2]|uniref:D-amino-acid transaminase n=1 Tax=Halalkalibacter sp. AB-rgal2 TaxID=3242695 RepID=UPI00359CC4E5